jgi:hypothetical protein
MSEAGERFAKLESLVECSSMVAACARDECARTVDGRARERITRLGNARDELGGFVDGATLDEDLGEPAM